MSKSFTQYMAEIAQPEATSTEVEQQDERAGALVSYKFAIGAKEAMQKLESLSKQTDPNGSLCRGLSKDADIDFKGDFRKMNKYIIQAMDIYENVMADVEDANR